MPDLDLLTADGPLRFFTLLHNARPVLLNLGEPGAFDITPRTNRVHLIDATYSGPWDLPVLGKVPAPQAVVVRPDGHVAWTRDPPGLPDALTTWFGPPRRGIARGDPRGIPARRPSPADATSHPYSRVAVLVCPFCGRGTEYMCTLVYYGHSRGWTSGCPKPEGWAEATDGATL
jgi:hypothetical protein